MYKKVVHYTPKLLFIFLAPDIFPSIFFAFHHLSLLFSFPMFLSFIFFPFLPFFSSFLFLPISFFYSFLLSLFITFLLIFPSLSPPFPYFPLSPLISPSLLLNTKLKLGQISLTCGTVNLNNELENLTVLHKDQITKECR